MSKDMSIKMSIDVSIKASIKMSIKMSIETSIDMSAENPILVTPRILLKKMKENDRKHSAAY